MRLQLLWAAVLLAACGSAERDASVATPAGAAAVPGSGVGIDARVALADASRILGDSAAGVWLVIASDFQCPWCRRWHDETAPAIKREYVDTRRVRLAYVNYPLGMHQHAVPAAEAAMCAGAQGKFWQMHDAIFAAQASWSPLSLPDAAAAFEQMGRSLGLDMGAWEACRRDGVMLPIIAADQQRASAAGVGSTPSFIIGNRRIDGAEGIAAFRPVLDAAIAEAEAARPRR